MGSCRFGQNMIFYEWRNDVRVVWGQCPLPRRGVWRLGDYVITRVPLRIPFVVTSAPFYLVIPHAGTNVLTRVKIFSTFPQNQIS